MSCCREGRTFPAKTIQDYLESHGILDKQVVPILDFVYQEIKVPRKWDADISKRYTYWRGRSPEDHIIRAWNLGLGFAEGT
jgi:hypothetical protein